MINYNISMYSVKIIDPEFDTKLFNSKANHPLQSWEWGEAREKMGITVTRFGEFDHDALINSFQMTVHPLGSLPYKIGYLPRSMHPSSQVFSFLQEYGQKNKLIFIKVEPYEKTPAIDRPANLVASPHALFPPWTQIVDLSPTEDELLKHMKQKTRYNIKLAQKKGVVVKEMSTDEGFNIFQKLYFDTCKRQKYFGHTTKYHEIIWNSLKNNIAHLLIAFYENTPLAAYELFHFHDRFYYPYGGTSAEYRNLMAANLLMWEAILLGKRLGSKKFDMWGSLPPEYDSKHDWAGFTRFKEGYGGEFVHLAEGQDLVINKSLYTLYNTAYKAREFYLRYIKLF